MSSIIFDGVTSNMTKKSLDMCAINHRVIAMNMANINTIGYKLTCPQQRIQSIS